MIGFGDFFWYLLWIFYFTVYIFMVFLIISDLFRDHKLNGWWKAVWIIFLIFVPFLTALVYVIARGTGMAERNAVARGGGAVAGGRRLPSLGIVDARRRHRAGEGAAGCRNDQPGRVRGAQEQGARKPVLRRLGPLDEEPLLLDQLQREHLVPLIREEHGEAVVLDVDNASRAPQHMLHG